MAGFRQESLGDYASQASQFAGEAAPSAFSPEVGATSNAYLNPATGKPWSAQEIIGMGGGDPSKMMNVPIGHNFMSDWGWTIPMLGAAGAALAAPAAGGAAAGEAGAGAGAGTAAEAEAAGDVGVGLTAPTAPSLAAMGGGTGLTTSAAGGGTLGATGVTGAGYGSSLIAPSLTAGGGAAGALGLQGGGVPGVQGTATPVGTTVTGGGTAPTTGGAATTGTTATGTPVDQAMNWMKSNASLLGLGATALSGAAALKKPPQMPTSEQLSQLGTEAQGVAKQLISQYQSGALSPGQQASLDQLTQQTKNQVNQYFSSIGQSDSTAHMQALAQIDQQAMVFKQQMLDNALSTGLQSIGIASGPLTQVANLQLQQDANLRQAFGGFAGALGQFFGSMAGKQPATPAPASTGTTPVVQSATAP